MTVQYANLTQFQQKYLQLAQEQGVLAPGALDAYIYCSNNDSSLYYNMDPGPNTPSSGECPMYYLPSGW